MQLPAIRAMILRSRRGVGHASLQTARGSGLSSRRSPDPDDRLWPLFAGSTPHGVLNNSGKDRYSIAFFYSPNPDSVIECAPSCTSSDNPPRYPPAVYRDLVLEFYRANYFHQKGHRSEVAAAAERHSVFRPAPAGS